MIRKRKELELLKQRQDETSLEMKWAIVMRLLEIQLIHHNALERLSAVGVELPEDVEVDVLDLIADLCGVPEDDTGEIEVWEHFRDTGKWPEGTYCRDWILDEWTKVQNGDASFKDFVAVLCVASKKEQSS